MRAGLNAHRAAQSLYETTVEPRPRRYWVAPLSGGRHMLGFDASGNIAEVESPDADSPEVQSRIEVFESIVAKAQAWPELIELKRLGH